MWLLVASSAFMPCGVMPVKSACISFLWDRFFHPSSLVCYGVTVMKLDQLMFGVIVGGESVFNVMVGHPAIPWCLVE